MTEQPGGLRLRCEQGPVGGRAAAAGADAVVVVDVLSFTTTVSVAVDRGIAVHPYPWPAGGGADDGAAAYARRHDAVLAVRRRDARPGDVTLSPAGMRAADGVARVVLPSPNGATLAHDLGRGAPVLLAASLRNATAVARWLAARLDDGATVAVVAAGERWPDGSLRPAVEDLWGAGAVLGTLLRLTGADASPEVRAAVAAHAAVAGHEAAALAACVTGRELAAGGWHEDVRIAAEADASDAVPVLRAGAFVDARSLR